MPWRLQSPSWLPRMVRARKTGAVIKQTGQRRTVTWSGFGAHQSRSFQCRLTRV